MAKIAADMVHPWVVPRCVVKWWYLPSESFHILAEATVYHEFVSAVSMGQAWGVKLTMSCRGRLVKASLFVEVE